MVGWHHPFNGREFEQTPGVGDGQGSLVCGSPWGCKELDTTQQLNNNNNKIKTQEKFLPLSLLLPSQLLLLTLFGSSSWPQGTICTIFFFFPKTLIYLLNYSPMVYWIALSRMYAAFCLHKIKPELLRPRLYMSDLGPSHSYVNPCCTVCHLVQSGRKPPQASLVADLRWKELMPQQYPGREVCRDSCFQRTSPALSFLVGLLPSRCTRAPALRLYCAQNYLRCLKKKSGSWATRQINYI